jgi:DNA phosphorothioation-dependent restriction protein DptG
MRRRQEARLENGHWCGIQRRYQATLVRRQQGDVWGLGKVGKMNQELMVKLQEMSNNNNAMAHRLLQWWMHGVSYEEWSSSAILSLLEQNNILRKAAIDAEMRAYPKPMKFPEER